MAIDATPVRRARVAAMTASATATALALATATALLLAACAAPPPTPDLATFLERRALCDHFRGEVPDPPDAQRMREVAQQVDAYCTGTDAQLAALKQRYRDDPAAAKQLAQFEDHIEH
jgi:hypothetical protein